MPNIGKQLLLLLTPFALFACSHWQAIASRDQLQNQVVQGELFQHRVFWNVAAANLTKQARQAVLWHVYIDGDGQPITSTGRARRDPTSPSPLLLPVLSQDKSPALYLGRPCYYQTNDPACHPERWTLERYSTATVLSLASAARQFIQADDKVILIGHSGGGTLAVLLAPQLPQTCAVITLAGNLHLEPWLTHHHFTPLTGSLDPFQQPPLPPNITQWHLAGQNDEIIHPDWIAEFAQRQPGAHYLMAAGAQHGQYWQKALINSLILLQNRQNLSANAHAFPLTQALDNSQSVCGKVTGRPADNDIYLN